MTCPPGHVPYLSEQLAANAVTLHVLAYPRCGGIHAFSCGDHHHIGHNTPPIGRACKAAHPARVVYS